MCRRSIVVNRLIDVLLISGLIGGISGWFGRALSSSLPNLPTGPVIILVAGAIFVSASSLLLGVVSFQVSGIRIAGTNVSLRIMLWNTSLSMMTLFPTTA